MAYAIIATGGKQYKVAPGDNIYVEKLDVEEGAELTFDVLLYDDGNEVKVGTPVVAGAAVKAKAVRFGKSAKIIVFKYKAKKGYKRKLGHRQPFTQLEITAIEA